ncbi:MAG: TolC family protein, partial [Planctomycetes bacterium]|nr:TolC family protein [Planctomycetota bacterium]
SLATQTSPEYQTAREQLYLTGLNQTDAEHLYELTPFASLAAGQTFAKNSRRGTGVIYENEIRGAQANIGIRKLLATGAVITTDLMLGSFDVISGKYRTGPASIFQAAITQPLLRRANRLVVLETLTQAQRNTLYQIRAFNRFRKTFYVSIVGDYYRLLELSQQLQNARDNEQMINTLYQKMEKLTQVGHLPLFELEQASQDALKARNVVLQTENEYQQMLDLFKLRLLIPQRIEMEVDEQDWQVLEDAWLTFLQLDENKAVDMALSQRLDLANAFDQVADAHRHVEIAADALKADLSLIGYVSPASHRRFTFGAEPGDLQRTEERYELSLRADLALDRVTERNNYKRVLISLMQTQRAHQQLSDQVEMEVRKAWRDMAEAGHRMDVLKQASSLAKKRLDSTVLLLQYGRSNTRNILDAQNDYYSAHRAFLVAVADYSIAQMEFLRDTEILRVTPNDRYEQWVALGQK